MSDETLNVSDETLLVVDDHAETRRMIAMTLRDNGFKVVVAEDGPQGLALAKEHSPALVLLDVSMPGMSGYEVCRRMRTMPELVNTRIVMFTANTEAEEKWQGFRAGADDYLTKPTPPEELLDRVEMMLDVRQRRLEGSSGVQIDKLAAALQGSGVPDNLEPPEASKPIVPDNLEPPVAPDNKTEKMKIPLPAPPRRRSQPLAEAAEAAPAASARGNTGGLGNQRESKPLTSSGSNSLVPVDGYVWAVVGARGGVGTTTTAINVATALAMNQQETTLIDFDHQQGHVAAYLKQAKVNGVRLLQNVPLGQWSAALGQLRQTFGETLHVLFTEADWGRERPFFTPQQTRQLMQVVGKPFQHQVYDLGHGMTPAKRAVIAQANGVVFCLQPERVAMLAGRDGQRVLKGLMAAESQIYPLMLNFTPLPQLEKEKAEAFLGHPIYRMVTIQYEEMAQAANKGVPLIRALPDSEAAAVFHQLGQALLAMMVRR
ncbi:MAG TPA: response regulator [Anaerolineae bacterium]|nr:response regulator [Anaerolineae bacterium]